MMYIADMQLAITSEGGRITASQPLAHHCAWRAATGKMHAKVAVLRYDHVAIAKRPRSPDGRGLVSLRRVDAAHNFTL